MEGKTSIEFSNPPAYVVQSSNSVPEALRYSRKSKALFGYAVAVTTALVVALVLGGVYYNRSVEQLTDIIKTYRNVDRTDTPVDQTIEVNANKNTVVFHLSGEGISPGTFAVMDYAKSLTGIYETKKRACYLIGGIHKEILDLHTLNQKLESNATLPTTVQTLNYQIADDYTVSDKTFLPLALKSPCAYVPVYWLEPATGEKKGIQKRSYCIQTCWWVWFVRICGWLCV